MFTKLKERLARRWLAKEISEMVLGRDLTERTLKITADNLRQTEGLLKLSQQLLATRNVMIESLREDADDARKVAHAATQNLCIAVDRLEKLTELPSSNGTAKKMQRLAREAIEIIEKEENDG